MTVELDHFIVSATNARAAARRLGELLGVGLIVAGVLVINLFSDVSAH